MSKLDILEAVRNNCPEECFLPDVYSDSEAVSDENESIRLLSIFKESLKQVGAEVTDKFPVGKILDFSLPEVWEEYGADCSLDKLYALEAIVLNGQFGVAENGSIWLDEDNFPNRLLPFVSHYLIIRLDKTQLVSNMIEAYQRIDSIDPGFGVFISGPSKTADIEQSLVYGAHGAKTLTVVLV